MIKQESVIVIDTSGKMKDAVGLADAETKRQLAMIDKHNRAAAADRIKATKGVIKSLEDLLATGSNIDFGAIREKIQTLKVRIAVDEALLKGFDPVPK